MRKENSGTRYFSFVEVAREAFGIKPVNKKSTKKMQEGFLANYICRGCKQPLKYVGGSVMVCPNPDCKGIKIDKTDEDGTSSSYYITSYFLLDRKHTREAERIFR